jgi:hypothetical protein
MVYISVLCYVLCIGLKDMVKKLRIDKVNGIVTLEITKNDLRNIIDSVDNMIDKQKSNLLENLPSEEEDRRKLDD